jgi:hypothetical protein
MMVFGHKAKVWNVCPPVSRADIWKAAGASRVPVNPSRADFAIELSYDGHKQVVWLAPGEVSEALDPVFAKSLAEDYKGQGIVVFDEQADSTDQRLAGLEDAIEFYNRMGDQQMLQFEVSLNEQQLKLMARDLEPFRINQAREKALIAFRDELKLEKETRPAAVA